MSLAPAKPRVAWTEAQARERFTDALGAASRYATLGATVQSLRLRLSVAPDTATRDVVKNELLARHSRARRIRPTHAARSTFSTADSPRLTPAEELIDCARHVGSAAPARAVTAFARALTAPALITPSDHLQYAQALARVGRVARRARAARGRARSARADRPPTSAAGCCSRRERATKRAAALRATSSPVSRRHGVGERGALSSRRPRRPTTETTTGARSLYQQLYRSYPTSARARERALQCGDHRARVRQRRPLRRRSSTRCAHV